MIKEQKVGVLAIIKDGDRFLLVKRNSKNRFEPGKWGFVGEAVEYGEDIIDALKRGIREEVGLELKSQKLLSVHSFIFQSQYNDKERHAIVIVFLCEVENNKVKINNEAEEFGWFKLDEIKKLNLVKNNEIIIDELNKSK